MAFEFLGFKYKLASFFPLSCDGYFDLNIGYNREESARKAYEELVNSLRYNPVTRAQVFLLSPVRGVEALRPNLNHTSFADQLPSHLVGCVTRAIDAHGWWYNWNPPGRYNLHDWQILKTNFFEEKLGERFYSDFESMLHMYKRREKNDIIDLTKKKWKDSLTNVGTGVKEAIMYIIGQVGGQLVGKVAGQKVLAKVTAKAGEEIANQLVKELPGYVFDFLNNAATCFANHVSKKSQEVGKPPMEVWDRFKEMLGLTGREHNVWEEAMGKDAAEALSWVPIVSQGMSIGQFVASTLAVLCYSYEALDLQFSHLEPYDNKADIQIRKFLCDMKNIISNQKLEELIVVLKDAYPNCELSNLVFPDMKTYEFY